MGFFFAWAVGEGIIVWRWAKNGAPPTPGALALPSALYFGLALAAAYDPARTAATAFAWALDVAVLLQVVGKDPKQATGWPPAMITDPSVILPGQKTSTTAELTAYSAAGTGQPSASIASPATGGGSSPSSGGVTLE
jgi:hypothetical protein